MQTGMVRLLPTFLPLCFLVCSAPRGSHCERTTAHAAAAATTFFPQASLSRTIIVGTDRHVASLVAAINARFGSVDAFKVCL